MTNSSPTPPAGWRIVPGGSREIPAYCALDMPALRDNLPSLLLSPGGQEERFVYGVFPNTPLSKLDGFGFCRTILEAVRLSGVSVTLATHELNEFKDRQGNTYYAVIREVAAFNVRDLNQPTVQIELLSQEFFDKPRYDRDGKATTEQDSAQAWERLYTKVLKVVSADRTYPADDVEGTLKRGLFHQQIHEQWNTFVVLKTDEGRVVSRSYPVLNVVRSHELGS